MKSLVKIFVSEFVCGGGWPEERIESSLAREGQAMLLALIEDAAKCPGVEVVTTWDARLGACPIHRGEVVSIQSREHEADEFRRLVSTSDFVWVIAPETGGVLKQRQALAFKLANEQSGHRCRVIGANENAIFFTTCKVRSGLLWQGRRVPTPGVHTFEPKAKFLEFRFPIVIKPRDGAGSVNTFLVRNETEWRDVQETLKPLAATTEFIQQPYVAGKALSLTMLIDSDGSMLEIFPVAEQQLSKDGRFRYLGGRIPADISEYDAWRVTDVVTRGVRSLRLTDLVGYIGCDVVLPDDPHLPPQLIEINPRLTSSYLGYRQLTDGNIPARLLGLSDEPLVWKKNQIEFAV